MAWVYVALGICPVSEETPGRFDESRRSQKSASLLCKRYNSLEGTK